MNPTKSALSPTAPVPVESGPAPDWPPDAAGAQAPVLSTDVPTGIMVCGHGSRDPDAIREFQSVARGIAERLPQYPVESGFLEFAQPVIRDGLDRLRERGVQRVLAVPGMLFAAGHVKNDVPSVLRTYAAKHDNFDILFGAELGIDRRLLDAAGQRIEAALANAGDGVPRHETLLMVVGRGASDPDANSNIVKVMRMLWEGLGLGWGETCYSGVTFPLVEPGLEHAARLGYRRIVVFPYFLFTGVLVKRIYRYTDEVAARHPDIEFIKADYLNDHPGVLDCFADRATDILSGNNAMNCMLCKYREQILGFEAEKGLAQESHHHHVEGIGTDADQPHGENKPDHGHAHEHAHDHSHDHGDHNGRGHAHSHSHADGGHDHHHHPYPHADHPLGPKSMG